MLTGLTQAFVSDLRHGPNKGGPKPKTGLFLESQTAGFWRPLYMKVELHRVGAGMQGGLNGRSFCRSPSLSPQPYTRYSETPASTFSLSLQCNQIFLGSLRPPH